MLRNITAMLDRIDNACQVAINGRFGFAFGPPTPGYHNRFGGRFYFQLRQIALSLRWDSDEAGRDFILKVGPFGMHGTIARRVEIESRWHEEKSTLKVRRTRNDRELSTWRNWRHVGLCFEWYPPARMVRVEAGPFGAAVMDGGW
jgi:hypothetical protein